MAHNDMHIITGPVEASELPKGSLGKVILEYLVTRSPNEVLNVDAVTKEVLTCGRLLEESVSLYFTFKSFGLQKGDVITIITKNNINYFTPVLSALYLGVVVNLLNPDYMQDEIKRCLLIAHPKVVLCSKNIVENILKLKDELQFIEKVFLIEVNNTPSIVQCLNDLTPSTPAKVSKLKCEEFDCYEQTAFILMSSGTTGLCKGVKLTHQNIKVAVIDFFCNPKCLNNTQTDTTVVVVSFFHVYGVLLQLTTFLSSMKSVIMNKFQPDLFLKSIEEFQATKLFLVPPLVHFLAKTPLINAYKITSVKEVYTGAAPLGKEIQQEVVNRLKNATINQLYGLTETTGPITLQKDPSKVGSVGCLLPGTTARVWNPETKQIVGPMEEGELCFKGDAIMQGYIPHEEYTDKDGFLHSGDVGFYDYSSFFYVVDRIKELIKYKGFQVSPVELETLLLTHPAVKDCGVVGIPHEKSGEVPLAFIVLEQGEIVNEQEIIQFVEERISVQKRLYGGVKFIEVIPRTPSGKILRRKLKELVSRLYQREGSIVSSN